MLVNIAVIGASDWAKETSIDIWFDTVRNK